MGGKLGLGVTLERVQKLNMRLIELDKEKNELVHMVSHNLKNPLTAIKLWVDVLTKSADRLPLEMLHVKLQNIRNMAVRMTDTINKFLDVEKFDTEGVILQMNSIDLVALVEGQMGFLKESAGKKSIRLILDCPYQKLHVQGDESAINDIIENLISNAIKYSHPETTTTVRLRKTPESICLDVQDEGVGFSSAEADKLFKKFSKLEALPTSKESSHGLGLYITHRLVKKLGGTISASSPGPGQGSTFRVELPYPPIA